MGNVIGYSCGALAVALILFSIWVTSKGGGEGLIPILAGFGLLLVAVSALRPGTTRL